MAAKLLHSLAEDNSDLQKQIGCMTGIFQLFDHQHILTGKRTAHKRLLLGNSRSDGGNSRRENSTTYHVGNVKESTGNRSVDEGQRVVTESSGASFSSSCSSSFSSMEFNRASLPEASSFDRIIFSRTASKGTDSLDLRDIVKECMYREARTLPVMSNKEKAVNNLSMHRDSSRFSQSKDGSTKVAAVNAKKNTTTDLDESLKVLAKLRDAPWYYNEAKQLQMSSYEAKDGTRHSGSRDVPRFSYDEKERNRLSFEAIKSAPKQKELPRLSLDGREGSMKSIPSHFSTNFQSNGFSNEKVPQKRVPGVVAKLMGLEALPHSSLASSAASNKASLIRTVETVDFPANPVEVPTSLQQKSEDRMMKPIQSSNLPLEIAPWSQFDGNRASSKPSLRANSSPSVYSEIEKRLKNVEFKQSGKDLRALKQILEAMQSKGLSRPESEGGANMIFQKDYEPNSASPRQINRVILPRNKQSNKVMGSTTHEPYSSSVLESQIVVMKPASLMGKSNISVSSVIQKGGHRRLTDVKKSASNRVLKNQSPRNNIRDSSSSTSSCEKRPKTRNVTLPQPSSKSQQVGQKSTLGSVKIFESVSPRLQQKKLESANRFRIPNPDLDRLKRTSNGRATNLSSLNGTSRRKSCSLLQSDDKSSEVSNTSRSLSYTGDEISQPLDDNLLAYPKMNTESTSRILPAEYVASRSMKKNSNLRCDEEDDSPVIISPEHPSPVSVLDPSAYRDDELSPVKKISNTLEGDHTLDGDNFFVEDQWRSPDDLLPQSMASVPINHQKLQNIDNLVQKLRGLNSHHDEAKTDYIALLCENTNPDFRYISEILLASGLLLRDLSSDMKTFQLHPSGHQINPELFFVLEQNKASSLSSKEGNNFLGVAEKSRRKLIFNVVNEILARKLQPISLSSEPFLTPNKVGSKTLTAQKLMKKLCCEIEQLRAKSLDEEDVGLKNFLRVDLTSHEDDWTDFHDEISGAVLDIERSIFKNLVDEIVVSEGVYLRAKSGRLKAVGIGSFVHEHPHA